MACKRWFDPAWLHHASPFGLRVAQPRKSLKGEAWCPGVAPLGEDGLEKLTRYRLPSRPTFM